jgi:hypothetical protein
VVFFICALAIAHTKKLLQRKFLNHTAWSTNQMFFFGSTFRAKIPIVYDSLNGISWQGALNNCHLQAASLKLVMQIFKANELNYEL